MSGRLAADPLLGTAPSQTNLCPVHRVFAMSGRLNRAKINTMPTGLKCFQKAESLHFITFSCFHRLPLLQAPGARETFEVILEQTRARHSARMYAYVLMPEHVHVLVNEPPQILLAQLLKALKQTTSRKLRGARQKLWQERYYDSNVRGEADRSEVIRYIHRNPVVRGWYKRQKIGHGRASGTTQPAQRAPSKSNRSGPPTGAETNCRRECASSEAPARSSQKTR